MTLPDRVPGLFDDLIDNLDGAPNPEETDSQTAPASLEAARTEFAVQHRDESETPPEHADLSFCAASVMNSSPEPAAPDGYLRLSEILRGTEFPERTFVVTHYDDAVRRGVIQAVVLEGQPFQVRYWQGDSSTRRTLQDELILRTPELEEWLRVQRLESRYAHRAATSNAATSLERLQNGQDDFQRLAKLRRQLLSQKTRDTA